MSTKIQETLTTQIAKIALEDETKLVLKDKFQPFFEQAEKWMDAASTLVVTDASQVNEMKMAREARLALKDIRVNVEKTRKALKEDSLRKSQAIDAIAGTLKGLIEPIENHLEQQEKFVEIQEQRRKQLLKEERIALLAPYEVPTDFYDLYNMPDENFALLLQSSKQAYEDRQSARRKEEEERIAKEKAEEEERERIKAENERLRKKAEEKERLLAEERKRAEDERLKAQAENERIRKIQLERLDKERREKEKAEAELRAKKAQEEKERKAKELADKKARMAPDKDKLIKLSEDIMSIHFPSVVSDEASAILSEAKDSLIKTSTRITQKTREAFE